MDTTKPLSLFALASSPLVNLSLIPLSLAGDAGGYAMLKRMLKQRRLLEKQPRYYLSRIALLSVLPGIGLCFFFTVHIWWFQLFNVVFQLSETKSNNK